MRTVVCSDRPEVDELIARRQRLGLDRYDEVWEGVYHVAPDPTGEHSWIQLNLGILLTPLATAAGLFATNTFNLGTGPRSYRVPDFGLHAEFPRRAFFPTAVLVGEILSPGDETAEKLPNYAACGVEELIVVDPSSRTLELSVRHGLRWVSVDRSPRLGVSLELLSALPWPPD